MTSAHNTHDGVTMRLMAARARGTLPLTSTREALLTVDRSTFDADGMELLRQHGTNICYGTTATSTLYVTFGDDVVPHEILLAPWLLDIAAVVRH